MRDIKIRHRMNGYEVEVGCQTIVLEGGPDRLCLELFKYLTNPAQVEQEWLERFGQKTGAVDSSWDRHAQEVNKHLFENHAPTPPYAPPYVR